MLIQANVEVTSDTECPICGANPGFWCEISLTSLSGMVHEERSDRHYGPSQEEIDATIKSIRSAS